MAINTAAILAGVEMGANGVANFAPIGTPVPTTAIAALNAGFKDTGLISEDGLKKAVNVESTDVKAFGINQPVRVLKTSRKTTFELTFLETNPTVLEIYYEYELGSITVGSGGEMAVTEGDSRTVRYAAVFDVVDGLNLLRFVIPELELTAPGEFEVKAGTPITYPCTFTAYPDSTNTAIYTYMVVAALAA